MNADILIAQSAITVIILIPIKHVRYVQLKTVLIVHQETVLNAKKVIF